MMFILKLIISLSNFFDMASIAIIGKFEGMYRFIVVLFKLGNGIVKILKISFREEIGNLFFALGVELF